MVCVDMMCMRIWCVCGYGVCGGDDVCGDMFFMSINHEFIHLVGKLLKTDCLDIRVSHV